MTALVDREVVHHDDVAFAPDGQEASLEIACEYLAVQWLNDNEGSGDRCPAQRGNERGDLPVAVRHLADQTFTAQTTPAQADHVDRCSRFVENQAVWIKLLLPFLLGRCIEHVGAILLRRVLAFFEADPVAIVEAPGRRDADLNAAFAQQRSDFFPDDTSSCSINFSTRSGEAPVLPVDDRAMYLVPSGHLAGYAASI